MHILHPLNRWVIILTLMTTNKGQHHSAPKQLKRKREVSAEKSGALILVEALEELGVTHIFGYPGGYVLPIYHELLSSPIKVILSGDERCAGHAAEGYARATGKVGVALVTSGPGATNLVTPLADARMDSTPVVGISGQVNTASIGKDAFQETPIQTVTMQITKHNYLVKNLGELGSIVREAFYVAATGRPGPVLIDITKDVINARMDTTGADFSFKLRGYTPERKLHMAQLDRAMDLIGKAKKPLLYVGQGVVLAGGCAELKEFAEKAGIPVAWTLLGVGAFPASHPLALGPLGMHGAAYANFAMHEADVVVALGARFDDRITGKTSEFATQAQFVHIDIDPSEINKNITVQVPVAADVKEALGQMAKRAKKGDHGDWLKRVAELKAKYPFHYNPGTGEIKPQYVLECLQKLTKGKAIVTTGVGQHQMWSFQYLNFDNPRRFITSGGLGTMGFGLPAAVGAQFGCPDDLVIDIDGNGSFEMNLEEMRTVADHGLPVKTIIMNNRMLGMVGQWQRKFFGGNYSSSEFAEDYPDFVAGIKALYGIPGRRITKREEVIPALEEMLSSKGPFLLDAVIPKEEDVYPMIPAGGTIKDIMLGEDQGHTPPV